MTYLNRGVTQETRMKIILFSKCFTLTFIYAFRSKDSVVYACLFIDSSDVNVTMLTLVVSSDSDIIIVDKTINSFLPRAESLSSQCPYPFAPRAEKLSSTMAHLFTMTNV